MRPFTKWTRRTAGSQWASRQARPYFFGEAGKSCEVCVWQQSLQAEYADLRGQVTASALLDLSKAYEHILFDRLWAKGIAAGFPLDVLRLLLFCYGMPRRIQLAGVATVVCEPRRAVAAGCSFADLMMRLYLLDILDETCRLRPSV